MHIASDIYTDARTDEQLESEEAKVLTLPLDKTGGLPQEIKLLLGKPYIIRVNIDVADDLVNGAMGLLQYTERSRDTEHIIRLRLEFADDRVGKGAFTLVTLDASKVSKVKRAFNYTTAIQGAWPLSGVSHGGRRSLLVHPRLPYRAKSSPLEDQRSR